jgi:hypothetical protein
MHEYGKVSALFRVRVIEIDLKFNLSLLHQKMFNSHSITVLNRIKSQ